VYQALLIIIIMVFLLTVGFAFLIWFQLGKFQQKALAAKRRQEAYLAELTQKDPSNPVIIKLSSDWEDEDDDRSGWI
jgi:flagellar basal body-associated protein FliL